MLKCGCTSPRSLVTRCDASTCRSRAGMYLVGGRAAAIATRGPTSAPSGLAESSWEPPSGRILCEPPFHPAQSSTDQWIHPLQFTTTLALPLGMNLHIAWFWLPCMFALCSFMARWHAPSKALCQFLSCWFGTSTVALIILHTSWTPWMNVVCLCGGGLVGQMAMVFGKQMKRRNEDEEKERKKGRGAGEDIIMHVAGKTKAFLDWSSIGGRRRRGGGGGSHGAVAVLSTPT